MHAPRLRLSVGAIGVCLLALTTPPAPADTKVIAGTCSLDLQAVRSADEVDVTTPDDGLCVTSDGLAYGRFTALDLDVTVGTTCALGAAQGGGVFHLDFNPLESETWSSLTVLVTYEEPSIEIKFDRTDEDESIVGVGTFVQMPTSDPDCDTTDATFTWSGSIAFEDPVIE